MRGIASKRSDGCSCMLRSFEKNSSTSFAACMVNVPELACNSMSKLSLMLAFAAILMVYAVSGWKSPSSSTMYFSGTVIVSPPTFGLTVISLARSPPSARSRPWRIHIVMCLLRTLNQESSMNGPNSKSTGPVKVLEDWDEPDECGPDNAWYIFELEQVSTHSSPASSTGVPTLRLTQVTMSPSAEPQDPSTVTVCVPQAKYSADTNSKLTGVLNHT
mmetsp:Transcript_63594/g.132393  ORF Transcript_63594/g.132393 Transcript_63594/m.132393 type:complete len:217 (-) Transcript_63594:667-1317(-)